LTTGYDNVPFFSPSGDRILFTRRANGEFDIYAIKPDGTDVKQLTKAPGNDAHAMWTDDGKDITFSSSRFGFKDEAALYGQICPAQGAVAFEQIDTPANSLRTADGCLSPPIGRVGVKCMCDSFHRAKELDDLQ